MSTQWLDTFFDWLGPTGVAVLKYAALLLSFAYGIAATVIDFHVERDGRRRLSRGGRFGIGLLVVGGVFGILVERYKDAEDDARRAEADSTARVEAATARARQDELVGRLALQLSRLEALDTTSRRSVALASAQLDQQGRLLDVQQGVAFNGSRALYREPRVTLVSAALEYRWDSSKSGPLAGPRSVRAYADRVAEAVDSLCQRWDTAIVAWRRTPIGREQARTDAVGNLVASDGDGWSWAPGTSDALPARFLEIPARGVKIFGLRRAAGASCAADSVQLAGRSPWLALAPSLRASRLNRVDPLGTTALELTLGGDPADSTHEALRVPVRTDPEGLAERQRYYDGTLVVDFARGTLRRNLDATPAAEPRQRTDRIVSLLDLPGTLLVVGAPELTGVEWLRVEFEGGRHLDVARPGFRRLADGRFAHGVTVAEIERTPGEFAELFRPRAGGPRPAARRDGAASPAAAAPRRVVATSSATP